MKKYKIIISFVFCFTLLLLSNSLAMPDLYFYNNFLVGQSPYYYTGSSDNTAVYYYPNAGNENTNQGFVTSYSTQFMNGNEEHNYIEAVDLDYTVGKIFELPSDSAFVVYSGSGQFNRLYGYGDYYAIDLGCTSPVSASVGTADNKIYKSSDISSSNLATGMILPSDIAKWDTIVPGQRKLTGNSTLSRYNLVNLPENTFDIFLIVNLSDESCFFTVNSQYELNSESMATYLAPYTSVNNVSMLVTGFAYNTSSTTPFYVLPHIKANLDVYSYSYTVNTSNTDYYINTAYNITCSIADTEEGVLFFIPSGNSTATNVSVRINLAFSEPDATLIPFFLNSSSLQYLYDKAIYIKDGYVNVNNYEELVSLLKQEGVGQVDLARIQELLELINSGGPTGAEVNELIGILENYHQQIQNNANFGNSTGVFDTYKNILEFTEDMHWLVTANNALFEYFAGFIMLCAMFLFLGRVMR